MANERLQRLMTEAPRGQPMDTRMLRGFGISPALATYLVKAGWLQRLGKGAYVMTGDAPGREGIIAFLARKTPGLHVGGKTALNWQGVRHNIALDEKVTLWAQKPYAMPIWVSHHLRHSFQTTKLFDEDLPYDTGLKLLPNMNSGVLVSVPERALLELASDVGKGQSLEEAQNLVAGLRNLRQSVLDQFLAHCHRVKVVKIVRDLGKSSGYAWGSDLQRHVDRLGPDKRWSNVNKDGERLTLKPK
ncbi:Type IV toxin-antitoxin system AbiEi family antitoxin [Pararobbsia alpina]|uniref:type IV toxin-antitoxin system AbiEi family antitoxin domain-containing protein n=1 Tax=Pararobbsia alpina TaxID=621374 RepID=UPI0039A49F97